MPEFISTAFANDAELSVTQALMRLVVALGLGCCVAGIYRLTRGKDADRRLLATLVLLTLLLSVTTIVIGNNVARAFSIVGALSIVRFRTVVEDTRDTAFVICAVAMGLAVGAGYLAVPLMSLPLIAFAAKLFSIPQPAVERGGPSFTLNVRVTPEFANRDLLQSRICEFAAAPLLMAIERVRAGAEIERSYRIDLENESDADRIIDRISPIEGVVGVEVVRRRN